MLHSLIKKYEASLGEGKELNVMIISLQGWLWGDVNGYEGS